MAVKKERRSTSEVEQLARAAGLDNALKQFPQDVAVAARSAALTRDAAGALDQAAAEPWPPMQVRDAK